MSYTTPPDPIGANVSFTNAPSLVGQFPELNTADMTVANNLRVAGHTNGYPLLRTVVGWTSKDFSTAAADAVTHLMVSPNLSEPTSTANGGTAALAVSQGAVVIPDKAVLESVQVVAEVTLAGDATALDVGTSDFDTAPGSFNLFTAAPVASVNGGAMAQGCNGATCLGGTGTAGLDNQQFVVVVPKGGKNSAGRLKFAITYWIAPSNSEDLVASNA